ncbi:MAG: hypothetical protein AAF394_10750, partial [Planctomycetota bacterium]
MDISTFAPYPNPKREREIPNSERQFLPSPHTMKSFCFLVCLLHVSAAATILQAASPIQAP